VLISDRPVMELNWVVEVPVQLALRSRLIIKSW
jgi:hypothetical protein